LPPFSNFGLTGAPNQQCFACHGLNLHRCVGRNPFAIYCPSEFLDNVFTEGAANLAQSPLGNRNTHLCGEPDQIPDEIATSSLLPVKEIRKQVNNSAKHGAAYEANQRTNLGPIA